MTPTFDWGNDPDNFPVHVHWDSRKFPHPDHARDALYAMWLKLGDWGSRLRLTTGAPLPRAWGLMAHLFVGCDLSWFDTPDGSPVGLAPHLVIYPPPGTWSVRGAWVDDRASDDPVQLGRLMDHEVRHLFGLTHADMLRPAAEQLAMVRAGALGARGWAEMDPADWPSVFAASADAAGPYACGVADVYPGGDA